MDRSASTLSIRLLGRTAVLIDDVEVTARIRPRALRLLKALASSREGTVSKDALVEMLWPTAPPDAGALSLRVTAHHLRRALGCGAGEWLIAEGGIYRLNESVQIDAAEFERLVREARSLEASGRSDDAQAAHESALGLYRGDYLSDDPYDDWAILARERLRDEYLYLLGRLAAAADARNAHTEAIQYAHRALELDPFREDMYRLLMGSHVALGQFARARTWYRVARQTIRAELGRDVSARTTAVYMRLLGVASMSTARRAALLLFIGGLSAALNLSADSAFLAIL